MRSFIKNWLLPPRILRLINSGRYFFMRLKIRWRVDLTKNDCFKNIHHHDRCFVVGTGPSINTQDLSLLQGELVIGVSGLFQHRDLPLFKPKYYVLPPIFRGHGHLFDEENFIALLKDMDAHLGHETVMFLDLGDKTYIDKHALFTGKKIVWLHYVTWETNTAITEIELLKMPSIWSVSEAAIQVALYLGFSKIYLLGFDHSWQDDIFKHFSEDYNKYFNQEKLQACRTWIDSEHEMIRHARIFNKYKKLYVMKRNIFNANANPTSYVDTFPKARFEELF